MPPRFEDPALDDLRDAAGEDDGCFVSRALYRDCLLYTSPGDAPTPEACMRALGDFPEKNNLLLLYDSRGMGNLDEAARRVYAARRAAQTMGNGHPQYAELQELSLIHIFPAPGNMTVPYILNCLLII